MKDMNRQIKNTKTPAEKAAKAELDKLIRDEMNRMANHISELIEKVIAESGLITEDKSDFIRVAQKIAKSQINPD